MNQRTSRIGHMHERQAVRSFPDDASRPIFQPCNVLVGEHFAWSVDEIAEVDIGGLNARCFHQSANGNADMGKPPGMAAEERTFADSALRIRLQIIGAADGEEEGPLSAGNLCKASNVARVVA